MRSANKDLQPELAGGGGDDRIFFAGGALNNVLGPPSPPLSGGSGNDRLVKRSGASLTLWGGAGRDFVDSRSGRRDLIVCGDDVDWILRDRSDSLRDCGRARPGF